MKTLQEIFEEIGYNTYPYNIIHEHDGYKTICLSIKLYKYKSIFGLFSDVLSYLSDRDDRKLIEEFSKAFYSAESTAFIVGTNATIYFPDIPYGEQFPPKTAGESLARSGGYKMGRIQREPKSKF